GREQWHSRWFADLATVRARRPLVRTAARQLEALLKQQDETLDAIPLTLDAEKVKELKQLAKDLDALVKLLEPLLDAVDEVADANDAKAQATKVKQAQLLDDEDLRQRTILLTRLRGEIDNLGTGLKILPTEEEPRKRQLTGYRAALKKIDTQLQE